MKNGQRDAMQSTLRPSAETGLRKRNNDNDSQLSSAPTGPPSRHDKEKHLAWAPHAPTPFTFFLVLVVIRTLAALYSPIADCDETFNYWEPMHYLLYRFGFQTWEYSPEYALRSYAYLYPYALVAKTAEAVHSLLTETLNIPLIASPKIFVFYVVRICLGFVSACSETLLYNAVQRRFGKLIALMFSVFLASSPGMFRSSVEFLPSTFSMVLLVSAFWAWMENHLFLAVFCVAIASLLGWVFSAVLAVPMAIDILLRRNGVITFLKYALSSGIAVIAFMAPIDTYYFGKIVIAPLNHILYNVFPKEGAGSHIFGKESWTFYAKNLMLNCNLPALVYVGFPCIFLLGCAFHLPGYNGAALKDRIRFLSGSYLAIALFIIQPHKEERFLAPCYPFIALVAAVGMNDWLKLISAVQSHIRSRSPARTAQKNISMLFVLICAPVIALSVLLGCSRILMQVNSFRAPLAMYKVLSTDELSNGVGPKNSPPEFSFKDREVNVCIGSEWYRFPTSFFLPQKRFRARFVYSGFEGLLPKPFQETEDGTRAVPPGMNQFNKADPEQFYNWTDGDGCHYFVTLDLSHRESDSSPQHSSSPLPDNARHVVHHEHFLDSDKSRAGYRAFYLPGFRRKLVYAKYQLVRNTKLLPFADRSPETLDNS